MTTSAFEIDTIKIIKIDTSGNQTLYATVDDDVFRYVPSRTQGNVAPSWDATSTAQVSQWFRKPSGITMDNNSNIYVSIGPMLTKINTQGETDIVVNNLGGITNVIGKIKFDAVTNSIFYQIINGTFYGNNRNNYVPHNGYLVKYHIDTGFRDFYYGNPPGGTNPVGAINGAYSSQYGESSYPKNYINSSGNFYAGVNNQYYSILSGTSLHPSIDYSSTSTVENYRPGHRDNVYGLAIDNSGYIFSTSVDYINVSSSGSIGAFGPSGMNNIDALSGRIGFGRGSVFIFTRDVYEVENNVASSTSVTEMRLTLPGNEVTVNNVTTVEPEKDLIKFTRPDESQIDTSFSGNINFGPVSKTKLSVDTNNTKFSVPFPRDDYYNWSSSRTSAASTYKMRSFDGSLEKGQWFIYDNYFVPNYGVNLTNGSSWDDDDGDIWGIDNNHRFVHMDSKGTVVYYYNHYKGLQNHSLSNYSGGHPDFQKIVNFLSGNYAGGVKSIGKYVYLYSTAEGNLGNSTNYDFRSHHNHPSRAGVLRVNKHDLVATIDYDTGPGYNQWQFFENTITSDLFESEWRTSYVYNNATYYLRIKTIKFMSQDEAIIFLGAGGSASDEQPQGNEHIKIIKFNFSTRATTVLVDSLTNNSGYQKLVNAGWSLGSGVYGMVGYHLDNDNNIYVPDMDPTTKMLYKLTTDTNITSISSAEAYWDGTGLITWGEHMNSTQTDRNTIITASSNIASQRDRYPSTLADGAGYVFRYSQNSTSWTTYFPRLYQLDLQNKTIRKLLNGSGETSGGAAVIQGNWTNAGAITSSNFYPFHFPTNQLQFTNGSNNYAFGLRQDDTRLYIPTNTGYIYNLRHGRAILHKFKDVKATLTSGNMALTHSVVRNYSNTTQSNEFDIIKTTVNNRGEIEKTKIEKLAGSIDCKDEIMRIPSHDPTNLPDFTKMSNGGIGTMYYSYTYNRLYIYNGTVWKYVTLT